MNSIEIYNELQIDLKSLELQKNGIMKHKSGIYDKNYIIFELQTILLEDQNNTLGI